MGDRNDAAAIRLTLRPQGLLAPLDQPTTTPRGRAAGHLYFRAFAPKGRPPDAPDMTTWGTSDNSQGGTRTRWIDAVMGCNGKPGYGATDQAGSGDVRLERYWCWDGGRSRRDREPRAERHASEPRYRAEDLVYEAWEAAGPRRAVLARRALALWPDCADGYVLLAQAASSWSARGPGWPKSRRRSYTPERPVWLRAAPCFLRP